MSKNHPVRDLVSDRVVSYLLDLCFPTHSPITTPRTKTCPWGPQGRRMDGAQNWSIFKQSETQVPAQHDHRRAVELNAAAGMPRSFISGHAVPLRIDCRHLVSSSIEALARHSSASVEPAQSAMEVDL